MVMATYSVPSLVPQPTAALVRRRLITPKEPLESISWLPKWTGEPDFQAGDLVDLFVNGVDQGSAVPAEYGQWSENVTLAEGDNLITLYRIRGNSLLIMGDGVYTDPANLDEETINNVGWIVRVEVPKVVEQEGSASVLSTTENGDHDSLTVEALLDSNRSFRIKFWETSDPSVAWRTNEDTTGLYGNPKAHRQTMYLPKPNTHYSYEFETAPETTGWYGFGGVRTYTTDPAPAIKLSDSNLGYGLFGWNCGREIQLLNSSNQYNTAICFVATQSATTTKVRVQNRTLTDGDVNTRGAPNSSYSSTYAIGYNASPRLTGQQCSMLFDSGQTYCWGNPVFEVVICPLDSQGLPNTSVVLAYGSTDYVPYDFPDAPKIINLDRTINISEGNRYAIAFMNKHDLVDDRPFRNKPDLCRSWVNAGNTGGYWGNNGSSLGNTSNLTGPHRSPAYGDWGAYTCYMSGPNGGWLRQPGKPQIPWYRYNNTDDNTWTGYGFWGYDYKDSWRDIGGSNIARMKFTVPSGFAFNADRWWVSSRWHKSNTPNGDPLIGTIKKNGTTVATAQWSPNYNVASDNRNRSGNDNKYKADYLLSSLSSSHNFDGGNYEAILSCNSLNGAWRIAAHPVHWNEVSPPESSVFSPDTSQAEFSSNNGSSWGDYPTSRTFPADDYYIGMQFVRSGEPARRA